MKQSNSVLGRGENMKNIQFVKRLASNSDHFGVLTLTGTNNSLRLKRAD